MSAFSGAGGDHWLAWSARRFSSADDGRVRFAKGASRASHAHPFGAHVHRQRHNGRWGAKSRHWRTCAIVKLLTAGFAQIFLNTGTVLEGNLAVFDNLLALTIWAMHR